jgi:hypothetical protein
LGFERDTIIIAKQLNIVCWPLQAAYYNDKRMKKAAKLSFPKVFIGNPLIVSMFVVAVDSFTEGEFND